LDEFIKAQDTLASNLKWNKSILFEHFERELNEFSNEIAEQNKRLDDIHSLLNYNIEYKNVLNFAARMTEPKQALSDAEAGEEKPNVL